VSDGVSPSPKRVWGAGSPLPPPKSATTSAVVNVVLLRPVDGSSRDVFQLQQYDRRTSHKNRLWTDTEFDKTRLLFRNMVLKQPFYSSVLENGTVMQKAVIPL